MSRELSVVEKKLLSSKVPKALGQGRKSYETKIEANDVLQKAGYDLYFKVDIPIDHKDKKAKLNVPLAYTSIGSRAAIRVGVKAGTSIRDGAGIGGGVKDGTRIGAGPGIPTGIKAGIGAGTSIGTGIGAGTSIGAGIGAGTSIGAGIGRGLVVTKADIKSNIDKYQVCNMCNMCNMCNICNMCNLFNFLIIFRRQTF